MGRNCSSIPIWYAFETFIHIGISFISDKNLLSDQVDEKKHSENQSSHLLIRIIDYFSIGFACF